MKNISLEMMVGKPFPELDLIMRVQSTPFSNATIKQADLFIGIPKTMMHKTAAIISAAVHPVSPVWEIFFGFENSGSQFFIESFIGIKAQDVVMGRQLHGIVLLADISSEFFAMNDSSMGLGYLYGFVGRVRIQDNDLISQGLHRVNAPPDVMLFVISDYYN